MLGPLLFKIYINDMHFIPKQHENIGNFADDTILFLSQEEISTLIDSERYLFEHLPIRTYKEFKKIYKCFFLVKQETLHKPNEIHFLNEENQLLVISETHKFFRNVNF